MAIDKRKNKKCCKIKRSNNKWQKSFLIYITIVHVNALNSFTQKI